MKWDNNKPANRTTQAAWLALANLMSLSIGVVTAAILSRFMNKAEYGTYRQVIYIYSTLLFIFSLGLPKAYSYFLARIPIEEGLDVTRKIGLLFLGLSSVFSSILFFGSDFIADLMRNPMLSANLKYFSVTPMLLMPVMGVENILTVYGMSRIVVMYASISRGFMIICTILPVIVLNTGASGAVIGFTVSAFITCIAGARLSAFPFRHVKSQNTHLSVSDILRFSMPVFTASIYGFIISSASCFFVSRYFGVEKFALFVNGYRELPFAGIIISSTAAVLLPEFSKMHKSGTDSHKFIELWKSAMFKSSAIIYPLSVFCCVFADDIICTIYGKEYHDAAILFRIITTINVARIVPYAPIMLALGKGKAFSNAHLVTAVLIVGFNMLCLRMPFHSTTAIAVIHTLCTVLCLIMMLSVIARSLNTTVVNLIPGNEILKILVSSAISGIMAKATCGYLCAVSSMASIITGLVVFVAIYAMIVNLMRIDYQNILKPIIPQMTKA